MELLHSVRTSPLKAGLLAFWLVCVPVLGLAYMMVPTSPDQALFDYIAWMNLHGAPYYKGAAEQNWPGEMLIHELGIRLFGVHFWTFRLIDFLLMQVASIGIFLFLKRAGVSLAPFVFLALYPVIYTTSGYWMAGQRDIVAAGILILASALLVSTSPGPSRFLQAGLAGSLIAFAVLIRPTYASFLFGVLLLDLLGWLRKDNLASSRIHHSLSIVGGFVLVIGSMVIAGLLVGSLGDWYEQTILFNLQVYPSTRSPLELFHQLAIALSQWWHWMALFAGAGLLMWLCRRGLRAELLLVVGLGLTILLSYFVQGKGFGYHLGGLIPLLVLLTAVSIDQLLEICAGATSVRWRWAVGATAFVVIAVTVVGTMKKAAAFLPQLETLARGTFQPVPVAGPDSLDADETRILVDRIQGGSSVDQYFFQWGRNFEIGYLSQRPSSTRFISTPAIDLISDRFEKANAWLTEFNNDLTAKPPAFILVDRSSLGTLGSPLSVPADASAALRILIDKINSGYRPVLTSDKVVLFERR